MAGKSRIGKKGQWLQFIMTIVIVLALGMVYLALGLFSNQINNELQLDASMSNQSKAVSQTHVDSQGSVFDSSILIIIAGLWLLCLAMAYNSQGSPLLLVVALFVIVAMGVVGMILSNTWEEFTNDADFSTQVSSYPMTNFMLDHYLVLVLMMGFSTVMVGISRGGGF